MTQFEQEMGGFGVSVSEVQYLNSKPGGGCGIIRSSAHLMQLELESGLSPDIHGLGNGNLPTIQSIHANKIVFSIPLDSKKSCDKKVNS